MSLQRWILVYLIVGSDFTRLMLLAFHGGGLLVVLSVGVIALAFLGGIVFRMAR